MGGKLEALLERSGELGKYQKTIVFLISLVYIPIGFTVFMPVFLYHMPQHRCYIPEVDEMLRNSSAANRSSLEDYIPVVLSSDGNFGLASCERFVVSGSPHQGNASKQNLSGTSLRETEECLDGWVYTDFGERSSVSSEFNLVCKNAWKRPVLTSSFMLGFLFGSFISGPLNDKFGRKKTSIIITFLNFLFIVLSAFSPSYELTVIAMIIVGAVTIMLYSSYFVLAQELVGKKHRAAVSCSINVFLTIGYLLLPGVAYLVTNWRWILCGLGMSFALFLPYVFVIPESPRWLASKRRNSEAYKIFERIARSYGTDKTTLEDLKMNNFSFTAKLNENSDGSNTKVKRRRSSVRILATNSVMLTRTLLVCWIWNVTLLCFFVLAYNTSNLGGNNYWNCLIAAAVDMPCHFFAAFSIQKFGRRPSVAAFLGSAGLFLAILPAFGSYPAATITFAMIGKFFASSTMGLLFLYTSELYPTLLRNTGIGMASMSSRISCILAPFLIYAGENGDRFIPFYVIATLGLITSVLCLFLPETKHTSLPDTMMDAVAMGANRSYPCLPKRFQKREDNQSPLAENSREDIDESKGDDSVFCDES